MSAINPTRKSTRVLALALLFVYLLIEGSCLISLFILKKYVGLEYSPNPAALSAAQRAKLASFVSAKKGQKTAMDPVLGWVSFSETNSGGMRDDREYEKQPPKGILRLSSFGDSFTRGSDVELDDTWQKKLVKISPSLEALNYGTGAYGFDQAYLRYLKVGLEYNPHIVVIGYMSENLRRNVNVFRPFYSSRYGTAIFTKPRFKLEDNRLVLLGNPLSTIEDYERFLAKDREILAQLGQDDFHYNRRYSGSALDFMPSVRFGTLAWYALNVRVIRPIFTLGGSYKVSSEAYQITEELFDSFYRQVLADGALPIILVYPDSNDHRRSRDGKSSRYVPLLEHFRAQGYRYIDGMEAIKPHESHYNIKDLTVEWGHFSPLAHSILAEYIHRQLKDWILMDQDAVKKAWHEERKRLESSTEPGLFGRDQAQELFSGKGSR